MIQINNNNNNNFYNLRIKLSFFGTAFFSDLSEYNETQGTLKKRCGWKEWVRVSEGGPYLLIEELILG